MEDFKTWCLTKDVLFMTLIHNVCLIEQEKTVIGNFFRRKIAFFHQNGEPGRSFVSSGLFENTDLFLLIVRSRLIFSNVPK